ncbi:hypothetical protein [Aneurinibacillus soli]|uniref:hypothetical protein n=1 Tax=Aneurinibacillus soli TaxID=1500254 RepID=UPI001560FDE6|nr:hypothetical protein [Aneurinibacillus soli]
MSRSALNPDIDYTPRKTLLRWLKEQVDKGLHISKAVDLLKNGEMHHPRKPALRSKHAAHTEHPLITRKQHELIEALLAFNESEAHHFLDLCLTLWDMESVLHDIIMPGEELHTILTAIQPHAVCLSVTIEENLSQLSQRVHDLWKAYPTLVISIGGQATQLPAFPENLAPYVIGTTRIDWEVWLSNLLDVFYHS